MSALEKAIHREVLASGAEKVGVAFRHLSSGAELLYEADHAFHPASTFKLCVMMEAYRRAEEGTFPLDAPIPITNEFPSIVDGSPYHLFPVDDSDPDLYDRIGSQLPVRNLIERMIERSGNLATNILLERLDPSSVTRFMEALGAGDLIVRRGVEDNKAFAIGVNNAATARGLTTCLYRLAVHKVVSPTSDREMIDVLLRQHDKKGIPRLLPEGTKIAHKTGWNGPLYHDAAIIYPLGEAPYILTVMTQGLSDEDEGPALVAKLSQLIYEARNHLD